MRILIAHNRYQQSGGEDNVVGAELELLRSHGHDAFRFDVDNDHIKGTVSRVAASLGSIYSARSKKLVMEAIESARPEIVHVHNFFPTLSPSIFHACSELGVPVLHTLHNYRIICAAATLFRDGAVCEECVTKRSILPGVQHACYRSSRIGSAIAGLGMAVNDSIGTWSDKVTAYIALTKFAAEKLGSFRIPPRKIFVKPNFAKDTGIGTGAGNYALFVGRLSEEKGIGTLIEADVAGLLCMDVVIIGDGPMSEQVQRAAQRSGSRLIVRGFLDHDQTIEYMREARVLLVPSIWFEGLPLVMVEAFSLGLPVIGADLGNVASLIRSGENGIMYSAGDHAALGRALASYADNPAEVQQMRLGARAYYLEVHTPEKNYERLMEIYEGAMALSSVATQ